MCLYKSLLKSTQNTRDLGGYNTSDGGITKKFSLIRSDEQLNASKQDSSFLFAHKITTVIDLRTADDVLNKPNSYLKIAVSPGMKNLFECIANAPNGVIFNCSAGKDRSGVVSAILLLHAGVADDDIVENYVLTKHYIRKKLDYLRKNTDLNMNIVTPCEDYMRKFLKKFRDEFGNTEKYFTRLGLSQKDIIKIRAKLL
jgi:protein-tyrosine phosphatase